jgi:hypothetical protein
LAGGKLRQLKFNGRFSSSSSRWPCAPFPRRRRSTRSGGLPLIAIRRPVAIGSMLASLAPSPRSAASTLSRCSGWMLIRK